MRTRKQVSGGASHTGSLSADMASTKACVATMGASLTSLEGRVSVLETLPVRRAVNLSTCVGFGLPPRQSRHIYRYDISIYIYIYPCVHVCVWQAMGTERHGSDSTVAGDVASVAKPDATSTLGESVTVIPDHMVGLVQRLVRWKCHLLAKGEPRMWNKLMNVCTR